MCPGPREGEGTPGRGEPPRRPLPPKGWREAARRATEPKAPAKEFGPRRKRPPRVVALLGKVFWTLGGLGLVPLIPGTVGTLAGVGLVYLATRCPETNLAILALACFFTLVGVPLASLAERVHGKDPQSFVWDEVAGYLVTMLGLPIQRHPWLCVVGGFFAFRIFDILKPWPIRSMERRPGGVSVVVDDVVAGLYANVLLHVILVILDPQKRMLPWS